MHKCSRGIRSPVAPQGARGRNLAARLSLGTTALALAICASAQASEVPVLEGHGRETAAGTLASKAQETGAWSASLSGAAGGPQAQASGVVSYPIPVKKGEAVKFTYRNEKQALTPELPCVGNVNEPFAEPGNLCVYRGGASYGAREIEDKNAKEVQFQDLVGESVTETGEGNSGSEGVDVIFRTNQFNATGSGPPATLTESAYLYAQGSWALRAK
jgi:hypothetical protein